MALRKIVSGGQTGADRAALDAARTWGIPVSGWVPAGREAEDGKIPAEFVELMEAGSGRPEERTALNVRDSDGTLILSHGGLTGGSQFTLEVAEELKKPVLHLDLDQVSLKSAVHEALRWLRSNGIESLNVAGPRASEDPRSYAVTFAVISGILASAEES
jgi:Circularly permutated YpsA SLOG family